MLKCECGIEKEDLRRLRMHMSKCKVHRDSIRNILTYEFLNNNIVKAKKTIDNVVEELNCTIIKTDIIHFLNEYNLNMYVCMCGKSFSNVTAMNTHKMQQCVQFKDYISKTLTKEFFIKNLVEVQMPYSVMSEKLFNGVISPHMLARYAHIHGFESLDQSQSIKSIHTQNKMKKTMLDRYGVENISQNEDIKDQKISTMLEHFGVEHHLQLKSQQDKQRHTVQDRYNKDNVSQVDSIKDSKVETFKTHYGIPNIFCNHDYIKEFYIMHWGVDNPSKVPEFELKKQDTIFKNFGVRNFGVLSTRYPVSKSSQKLFDSIYNSIDIRLREFCYYYNLNTEYHVNIGSDKYIYLDFSMISSDVKLSIEFNGDFWHMNPDKYKPTDINAVTKMTAFDAWENDRSRHEKILECGFSHLIIWESEIVKEPEQTLNKCLMFIKNITHKYYQLEYKCETF